MAQQMPGLVPNPLQDRLIAAAQHHAHEMVRLAQQPWTELGAIDTAIRAGSGVELLAKAVLAGLDARLIAKGEDVHHHLLDTAVEGDPTLTLVPRKLKANAPTIDASVAVALAGRLDLKLSRCAQGALRVGRARNDAVHFATARAAVPLTGVVTDAIIYVDAAVAALGRPAHQFWDDLAGSVNQWLARHGESAATEARRLVQAAADAHRAREVTAGPTAWPIVLEALRSRVMLSAADLDALVECPACHSDATVEWEADVDAESDHGEVTYYSGFLLVGLTCQVCDLRLDGEHVDALQLPDLPPPGEVYADQYDDVHGNEEYWPGGEEY